MGVCRGVGRGWKLGVGRGCMHKRVIRDRTTMRGWSADPGEAVFEDVRWDGRRLARTPLSLPPPCTCLPTTHASPSSPDGPRLGPTRTLNSAPRLDDYNPETTAPCIFHYPPTGATAPPNGEARGSLGRGRLVREVAGAGAGKHKSDEWRDGLRWRENTCKHWVPPERLLARTRRGWETAERHGTL